MRKRNIQILFRLDKKVAQDFQKKVRKSGLAKESFLRQMIAGYELHEKPDAEFYNALRELSAIGNRVNQLAAKANALNFIDAPLLNEEAKRWAKFRLDIQEKYLMPERNR